MTTFAIAVIIIVLVLFGAMLIGAMLRAAGDADDQMGQR